MLRIVCHTALVLCAVIFAPVGMNVMSAQGPVQPGAEDKDAPVVHTSSMSKTF